MNYVIEALAELFVYFVVFGGIFWLVSSRRF